MREWLLILEQFVPLALFILPFLMKNESQWT